MVAEYNLGFKGKRKHEHLRDNRRDDVLLLFCPVGEKPSMIGEMKKE